MKTDSLLADLRAVMAEATPGPWRRCRADGGACQCGLVWNADGETRALGAGANHANLEAVVALRNAWPAIEAALAQAEADRAELPRYRRHRDLALEVAEPFTAWWGRHPEYRRENWLGMRP